MIASMGMSIKWSSLSHIKMIDNNDTLGGRNATDKNLAKYTYRGETKWRVE